MAAKDENVISVLLDMKLIFSEEVIEFVRNSCSSFLEDVQVYLQSVQTPNIGDLYQQFQLKVKAIEHANREKSGASGRKQKKLTLKTAGISNEDSDLTNVSTELFNISKRFSQENLAFDIKDTNLSQYNDVLKTLSEKVSIFDAKLMKHLKGMCDSFLKSVRRHIASVQMGENSQCTRNDGEVVNIQQNEVSISDILCIYTTKTESESVLIPINIRRQMQHFYDSFIEQRGKQMECLHSYNKDVEIILIRVTCLQTVCVELLQRLNGLDAENTSVNEQELVCENPEQIGKQLDNILAEINKLLLNLLQSAEQYMKFQRSSRLDLDIFLDGFH